MGHTAPGSPRTCKWLNRLNSPTRVRTSRSTGSPAEASSFRIWRSLLTLFDDELTGDADAPRNDDERLELCCCCCCPFTTKRRIWVGVRFRRRTCSSGQRKVETTLQAGGGSMFPSIASSCTSARRSRPGTVAFAPPGPLPNAVEGFAVSWLARRRCKDSSTVGDSMSSPLPLFTWDTKSTCTRYSESAPAACVRKRLSLESSSRPSDSASRGLAG
mmetsp:Transcript_55829/g.111916  ORF Transcript_55829/g.111916 Transcript_55829/m.111916 type:complete len:216 (-) Transcript_55829:201-848(-)